MGKRGWEEIGRNGSVGAAGLGSQLGFPPSSALPRVCSLQTLPGLPPPAGPLKSAREAPAPLLLLLSQPVSQALHGSTSLDPPPPVLHLSRPSAPAASPVAKAFP